MSKAKVVLSVFAFLKVKLRTLHFIWFKQGIDMKKNTEKETKVRSSLLEVMYGVVLAYGFNFFDSAGNFFEYFRFFFAYAVIILDWIYVHRIYWEATYTNIYLVLDIGILFSISRLLFSSSTHTPDYYLWLSILFIFYVVWDVISMVDKQLPSQYDWRYSISGDIFASLVFFTFWIALSNTIVQIESAFLIICTLIVYSIAFMTWFKKAPYRK
jgi:hypothetical protein